MNETKRDVWDEGEYLDLWSVVHGMAGMAAGFVPILFDVSFMGALLVFFIGTLLWEVAEVYAGIVESRKNIALDIVIALCGFASTPLIVFSAYFDTAFIHMFFGVVVLTLILLSIRGWFAYRTREGKKRLRDIAREL